MRFELPEKKTLVCSMSIPIRWGDMDLMGHVNNTVYFRYFESVRLEWLRRYGAEPNPNGLGPVIVNAFCTFASQVTYPGTLVAKHYVANPGRSSVETYFTLARDEAPDVVCTSGGAKMVWVDARTMKSAALPGWLLDVFRVD